MNPEIKKLWIEALESGKYQKTKAVLRNEQNQFCCLGVLCDLYDPNLWEDQPETDAHIRHFAYSEENLGGIPPNRVTVWAGLTDDLVTRLYTLNDNTDGFGDVINAIDAL